MSDTFYEKWARGSLRLVSSSLSPEEITRALQIEPTETYAKGDRTIVHNPRSALFEENVWLRESGLPSNASLQEHVEALLKLIDGHEAELAQLSEHAAVDLFLGFAAENGQGELSLSHSLLEKVAALPVHIIVDLHVPE